MGSKISGKLTGIHWQSGTTFSRSVTELGWQDDAVDYRLVALVHGFYIKFILVIILTAED
jgi:hypothetical protein